MSESPRQSYYEIALTNRQVLTVFVVLLVSVLVAFLAGVWVGRREGGTAVATVEAQTITAAAEPAEEPLERLEFFSRDDGAGGEAPAEPVAAPADPPADPPAMPSDEPAAEEPSGSLVAMPEMEEPEPALEVPAEPAATVAEAPTPEPEAPAAIAEGTLVVQVFSSNNQVQAQGVVDRLRAGGFPALLSPVEVSGRTMYRVRIGPYGDRSVAEGIAEQVRREYRLETWITE